MTGWKVFLRSGRVLEIRKDGNGLREEVVDRDWLTYKTDGLFNRIRVAEIESVHQLIELPRPDQGGGDRG
ncbi:MAG TPA: hypothetical protein VHO06_22350 [Polyangia bacterium]|nr:hypothetical protein [Polyangia bacterium]